MVCTTLGAREHHARRGEPGSKAALLLPPFSLALAGAVAHQLLQRSSPAKAALHHLEENGETFAPVTERVKDAQEGGAGSSLRCSMGIRGVALTGARGETDLG